MVSTGSITRVSIGLILAILVLAQQSLRLATNLGVADCDDVAIGPSGDLYLACHSPGDRLPVTVKAYGSGGGMDGYVIRIDPGRSQVVFAARIGGSDYDNTVRIRVDEQGSAYAAGFTKSRNFPASPDALQRVYAGGDSDALLVKLRPDGTLAYSTFLGGSAADQGNGLEVDSGGVLYVGGTTWSADFPGKRETRSVSQGDAFVARLENGTLRSAVFGGELEEKLTGLALDGRAGIAAVGYTTSGKFPVIHPLQPELRGPSDLFLTRLSVPDLNPTFSTYFGGSGDDSGWGVAAGKGVIAVAGITSSADLPISAAAYQSRNRGASDAFLATFRGKDWREVRATYFGGSRSDESGYDGGDIRFDAQGRIWLAGITSSEDLPLRNAAQNRYGGGETDGFLASFTPDLQRLCSSTYFGGADRDLLEGMAIRGDQVVATGLSFSPELPVLFQPVQPRTSILVGDKIVNVMLLAMRAGACP